MLFKFVRTVNYWYCFITLRKKGETETPLAPAQDIKSLDDKRLGRLFGPAYEEPSPADPKEKVVVDQAPPPRDIFTYLDKSVSFVSDYFHFRV